MLFSAHVGFSSLLSRYQRGNFFPIVRTEVRIHGIFDVHYNHCNEHTIMFYVIFHSFKSLLDRQALIRQKVFGLINILCQKNGMRNAKIIGAKTFSPRISFQRNWKKNVWPEIWIRLRNVRHWSMFFFFYFSSNRLAHGKFCNRSKKKV